jgi:hypothetical protein
MTALAFPDCRVWIDARDASVIAQTQPVFVPAAKVGGTDQAPAACTSLKLTYWL